MDSDMSFCRSVREQVSVQGNIFSFYSSQTIFTLDLTLVKLQGLMINAEYRHKNRIYCITLNIIESGKILINKSAEELYIHLLSPQYTVLHILLFIYLLFLFTYIYIYILLCCVTYFALSIERT